MNENSSEELRPLSAGLQRVLHGNVSPAGPKIRPSPQSRAGVGPSLSRSECNVYHWFVGEPLACVDPLAARSSLDAPCAWPRLGAGSPPGVDGPDSDAVFVILFTFLLAFQGQVLYAFCIVVSRVERGPGRCQNPADPGAAIGRLYVSLASLAM